MKYEELQNLVLSLEEQSQKNKEEIASLTTKYDEMSDKSTLELESLRDAILSLTERFDNKDCVEFDEMRWNLITGTTNATAGVESSHEHLLPKAPKWVFLIATNATSQPVGANNVNLCGLYESKASDNQYIYVKATSPLVSFKALCLI